MTNCGDFDLKNVEGTRELKCKHETVGGKQVTKVMILAFAVGVDENGLTGAHMLVLLLKCLFSTYRFDSGAGK